MSRIHNRTSTVLINSCNVTFSDKSLLVRKLSSPMWSIWRYGNGDGLMIKRCEEMTRCYNCLWEFLMKLNVADRMSQHSTYVSCAEGVDRTTFVNRRPKDSRRKILILPKPLKNAHNACSVPYLLAYAMQILRSTVDEFSSWQSNTSRHPSGGKVGPDLH